MDVNNFKTIEGRLSYIVEAKYQNKQKFLAQVLNVSESTISRWLKNMEGKFPSQLYKLRDEGISVEWLEKGEGMPFTDFKDIPFYPQINFNKQGVPFYNIDVTASIIQSFNDIIEQPEYYIDFKPFNDCTAYFMVFGDSMYPMFASGEIIAVKQINNLDVVLWGEPYLIITNSNANEMRTVKLLFQHNNPSKIILRSSNPNFSGDTVINKKDIINLFIVKGKITRRHL